MLTLTNLITLLHDEALTISNIYNINIDKAIKKMFKDGITIAEKKYTVLDLFTPQGQGLLHLFDNLDKSSLSYTKLEETKHRNLESQSSKFQTEIKFYSNKCLKFSQELKASVISSHKKQKKIYADELLKLYQLIRNIVSTCHLTPETTINYILTHGIKFGEDIYTQENIHTDKGQMFTYLLYNIIEHIPYNNTKITESNTQIKQEKQNKAPSIITEKIAISQTKISQYQAQQLEQELQNYQKLSAKYKEENKKLKTTIEQLINKIQQSNQEQQNHQKLLLDKIQELEKQKSCPEHELTKLNMQTSFKSGECFKAFKFAKIPICFGHTNIKIAPFTDIPNYDNAEYTVLSSNSWSIKIDNCITTIKPFLKSCLKEFQIKKGFLTCEYINISNIKDSNLIDLNINTETKITFHSYICFKEFEKQNIDICLQETSIQIVSPMQLNTQCNNENISCLSPNSWIIEIAGCRQQNIISICEEEFKERNFTICNTPTPEISGEIHQEWNHHSSLPTPVHLR